MRGAIWLVGMMGAGKSTVGPRLAERLGRPFVDTDEVVRKRAGKEIAEIFEVDGEAAFRALEAEVVAAAGAEGAVVALGGGAVAQPGAAARLAESGTLVYLRARPETLLARIGDPASRPLLAGLEPAACLARLEALLREREPAYASAVLIVDVDDQDAEATAAWIAQALESRERVG
jgi:shikimate kinase/3-dehydroquinate synthase